MAEARRQLSGIKDELVEAEAAAQAEARARFDAGGTRPGQGVDAETMDYFREAINRARGH
jgi:hypothetical protein